MSEEIYPAAPARGPVHGADRCGAAGFLIVMAYSEKAGAWNSLSASEYSVDRIQSVAASH